MQIGYGEDETVLATYRNRIEQGLEYLLSAEERWSNMGYDAAYGTRVRNGVPIEIRRCYLDLGEPERALCYFTQGNQLWSSDLEFAQSRIASSELAAADACNSLNQTDTAILHYNKALALCSRSDGDTSNEIITACNVAAIYTNLSKRETALIYYSLAYAKASRHSQQMID